MPAALIKGNGSGVANEKAIKGRARRKGITKIMALNLIDVAANKGENERLEPCRNAWHS